MALFESYERRIDQINAVLNSYGISSIEEAEKITKDAGLNVYDQVKKNNEVIGYQFVSLGKMTDFIKKGDDPNTAWEKAKGQYGRVDDAVKIIDPRQE